MSNQRATSFPANPAFGATHLEHGRTWEFVAPGMWKSIAGEGGADAEVTWANVKDKPDQIEALGVDDIIDGGNY